jgi:predicted TIM-barrel fold metal-dependent hydrolase
MRLPLTFDPVSNGEYFPPRKTARDCRAEAIARRTIERNARRAGMGRRQFLISGCGMAACLAAINEVHGSQTYVLPPEALVDPAAADAVLAGDEFIFDIQTHHVMPGKDWEKINPAMKTFLRGLNLVAGKSDFGRYHYTKEIFLDSDTSCAVLSAVPATAEGQPLPQKEADTTRQIIETLGKSPRLYVHALVAPNLEPAAAQLEAMERAAKEYKIAAWKVYTLWGPSGQGFWHDDEKYGIPMIEKARSLGIKIICTHKGFRQVGVQSGHDRARDVGVVAKRFPDVKFIVYHSGYDSDITEGPHDPKAERGSSGLINGLEAVGLKPGSNVYAEIGSSWFAVMRRPQQAGHFLGKLLKHVGPDNVLWGTDSIWYGSPQPQIQALRAFQIPAELREKHGYPELTAEIKAKIFGLNSAKVYGVDPKVVRPALQKDEVEKLKTSYLPRRDPWFTVYGPRTRRELLALWRARGGLPA